MRTARLFQNGQSQAVRLPKEFRFSGDRVYIKRVGSAVVLLSYEEPWEPLIASITLFSEDFMATREEPPQQEREAIFP
jgi:antitoxin VapB